MEGEHDETEGLWMAEDRSDLDDLVLLRVLLLRLDFDH
jgi:hypothetical protein